MPTQHFTNLNDQMYVVFQFAFSFQVSSTSFSVFFILRNRLVLVFQVFGERPWFVEDSLRALKVNFPNLWGFSLLVASYKYSSPVTDTLTSLL